MKGREGLALNKAMGWEWKGRWGPGGGSLEEPQKLTATGWRGSVEMGQRVVAISFRDR